MSLKWSANLRPYPVSILAKTARMSPVTTSMVGLTRALTKPADSTLASRAGFSRRKRDRGPAQGVIHLLPVAEDDQVAGEDYVDLPYLRDREEPRHIGSPLRIPEFGQIPQPPGPIVPHPGGEILLRLRPHPGKAGLIDNLNGLAALPNLGLANANLPRTSVNGEYVHVRHVEGHARLADKAFLLPSGEKE